MKTLSSDQAKTFYDDFGSKQDDQSWYEEPALECLLAHLDLSQVRNVLEFGCGTGKLAHRLLEKYLSSTAQYTGLDISDTMISLARKRTEPYSDRTELLCMDGSKPLPFQDQQFDCILSTYVLDILAEPDIRQFFQEAHRLLIPCGTLGLISITKGNHLLSKLVMGSWSLIHRISPAKVGGCRPLILTEFFQFEDWKILYHSTRSVKGITSDILVLENICQ